MKTRIVKSISTILVINLLLFSGFFQSCNNLPSQNDLPENPNDPKSSNYIPPGILIDTPHNNDVITADTVKITWRDTANIIKNFTCRLDNLNWSTPTNSTDTVCYFLENGPHTFNVMGTNDYSSIGCSVEVNVQSVPPNSLTFSPRFIQEKNKSSFVIHVVAKGVSGLFAVKFTVQYNASTLIIDTIQTTCASGYFSTPTSTSASFEVILGSSSTGPEPFTGTDTIATIFCRAMGLGSTDLKFIPAQCSFEDENGNTENVNTDHGGRIVVQ